MISLEQIQAALDGCCTLSPDKWRDAVLVLLNESAGGGGGGGDASAANQVTGNTSLDSIDDKTPALGQALAAASVPVVLTALQLAALSAPTPTTPAAAAITTETVIAVGVASTAVLAANAARIAGWVKNIDETYIWVSFSGTATAAKPTKLAPGEVLQLTGPGWRYTGAVSAIQTAGSTLNLEVVQL